VQLPVSHYVVTLCTSIKLLLMETTALFQNDFISD